MNAEKQIKDILYDLEIKPHIKGFNYCLEAVKECLSDNTKIDRITKDLYPTIAFKCQTTPSKTERAIRHAIKTAWYRNKKQFEQFHMDKTKPTNSEFIAMLVEYVKDNSVKEDEVE